MGDFPIRQMPLEILKDLLGRAGGPEAPSPWRQVEHWLETKPYFAEYFIRGESTPLAVGASRIPITAYKIPDGMVAVLKFIANACGATTDYPSVIFELDVDGAPVGGFANLVGPISPAIQAPFIVTVGLLGGQRASWVASNTGALAIASVKAFLGGWYWQPAHDNEDAE